MILATEPIDEVMYPDWRFVLSDAGDFHRKITEYDDRARLGCRITDQQLSIFRWSELARTPEATDVKLPDPGYLRFRDSTDPETGEKLKGEPDARILADQQASDAYKQDRRKYTKAVYAGLRKREEEFRKRSREMFEDRADMSVYGFHRLNGIRHHAYVPDKGNLWLPRKPGGKAV